MDGGRIILLVLATVLTLVWIRLAVKYEKEYEPVIRTIDSGKYKYPELFCVGFAIMKILKIDSRSRRARKRVKEIAEVQGKRYAEYYFYVINAEKWTYGFTILVLFALFAALGNELLADMPQVLSKMTLLVNSGMMLRDAWKKVAYGGERVLYKEMQITVQEMQNGISELDAYRNFADRCAVKEIRRFSSTMIQNMQKGNAEISYFLKELSNEMWEEKKHFVKRKGETANSKLLIPTAMIFIGILGMIMIPAFLTM